MRETKKATHKKGRENRATCETTRTKTRPADSSREKLD
jgi:hypothetical protein